MSLSGGKKSTTEEVTISNPLANPVKTESIINGKVAPEPMGMGLEMRVRSGLYPEIQKSARSVHNQTNFINTTERSFGMPQNSGQDLYHRPTGTTGIGLQISSTSANDAAAGTGAITIYIEGIKISDSGNTWTEESTFSSPTTLNGQTAVQIGTDTDWYRVNKIWVLTTGSGGNNDGDLYISPNGQSLTSGVPDANIIRAVIANYAVSTGGSYSVASGLRFEHTFGNFYIDPSKTMVIHECFAQDFNGSGNTADMVLYEVGEYDARTTSYSYQGAAPYTEKSDIILNIRTQSGTADHAVYYVEYCPITAANANL